MNHSINLYFAILTYQ